MRASGDAAIDGPGVGRAAAPPLPFPRRFVRAGSDGFVHQPPQNHHQDLRISFAVFYEAPAGTRQAALDGCILLAVGASRTIAATAATTAAATRRQPIEFFLQVVEMVCSPSIFGSWLGSKVQRHGCHGYE